MQLFMWIHCLIVDYFRSLCECVRINPAKQQKALCLLLVFVLVLCASTSRVVPASTQTQLRGAINQRVEQVRGKTPQSDSRLLCCSVDNSKILFCFSYIFLVIQIICCYLSFSARFSVSELKNSWRTSHLIRTHKLDVPILNFLWRIVTLMWFPNKLQDNEEAWATKQVV